MKIYIRVGSKQERTIRCRNNRAAEINAILNLLDEMEIYGVPVLIEVRDNNGKLIRMHERDENMEWKFY